MSQTCQNFIVYYRTEYSKNGIICELKYHDQKIRRTPTNDIRKHLLGFVSSVYYDFHHKRSNQQPQSRNSTTEPTAHIAYKWRQTN